MNNIAMGQLVKPLLYAVPVILAFYLPHYISNWQNGLYGKFGAVKEVLKNDPICISGFAHCIEGFNAYPNGLADNEENICLYVTVFIKCIFIHCDVKSARRRHAIKDAIKGNLTSQDIECDFHFKNNKAKCLLKSHECESELIASIDKKVGRLLCPDFVKHLKCRFEECPTTEAKQLEVIHSSEALLLEKGMDCEIPHKKLLTSVRCLEPDMFQCDNGECILRDSMCDQVNDCTDNSDEMSCDSKNSQGVQYFSRKQQRKVGIL